MNIAETAGGSSRKGQENGDASNESERPLKKARFAWQVKGKYHLKNDANDTAKSSSSPPPEPDAAESSGSGSSNSYSGTEQNLEILGDYLMKQDFNTLDSVIVAPDQSLLAPSTSIPQEKLSYPRYVSTYEQNMANIRNSETCNMNSHSMSMVITQRFSEDQCIARWQTKQMVKGFVDNTINRVLDLWIQAPLPPEDDHSRSVALDVADFINNMPGDNSVENEGILMAISAHGLQQPVSDSSDSDVKENTLSSGPSNDIDDFCPFTPPTDDESHDPANNNQCDTDTSHDIELTWPYESRESESNNLNPFPLFPDQNSNAENPVDNHRDFLDEAILFAIQSKGLTTFGSDYG